MATLGERIRAERVRARLTLTELGQRASVSKGYLSDLENGEARSPSDEVLSRLVDALETTVPGLLEGTDAATPDIDTGRGRPSRDHDETGRDDPLGGLLDLTENSKEIAEAVKQVVLTSLTQTVKVRSQHYDWERVRPPLEHALRLVQEHLDAPELEARLLAELAATARQQRDFQRAHGHADALLALSFRVRDAEIEARACYELGRLLAVESPSDEAADFLDRAARGFSRSKSDEGRRYEAWSIYAKAVLDRKRGRIEQALDTANKAERRFSEDGDPYGSAAAQLVQGFCYRLVGQISRARDALRRALDTSASSPELRYRYIQADAKLQLGELELQDGDNDSADRLRGAEELLEASFLEFEGIKHSTGSAFALAGLGTIRYQRDETQAAVKCFSDALRSFRSSAHKEGCAVTLMRLSGTLGHLGQLAKAAASFEEAASLYAELGNSGAELAALAGLALAQARSEDDAGTVKTYARLADLLPVLGPPASNDEYTRRIYGHSLLTLSKLLTGAPYLMLELRDVAKRVLRSDRDRVQKRCEPAHQRDEWGFWVFLQEPVRYVAKDPKPERRLGVPQDALRGSSRR